MQPVDLAARGPVEVRLKPESPRKVARDSRSHPRGSDLAAASLLRVSAGSDAA